MILAAILFLISVTSLLLAWFHFLEQFDRNTATLARIEVQNTKIMNGIDSIKASLVTLTATVDDVVTALNLPEPTEAELLATAAALDALNTRLKTALGTEEPV